MEFGFNSGPTHKKKKRNVRTCLEQGEGSIWRLREADTLKQIKAMAPASPLGEQEDAPCIRAKRNARMGWGPTLVEDL